MITFNSNPTFPAYALRVAMIVLLWGGMGPHPSAALAQDSESENVTMAGPGRILAPAVQKFVERCHCIVTYEDVKWRQDQVEVWPGFQRRRPEEPMILVPKAVPFTFRISRQIESQTSAQIAASLQDLITAYENNLNVGSFRLVETNRAFHIIPTTNAVFDVPVTLEAKDWSVQDVVSAVVIRASQATGERIGVSSGPNNLMAQTYLHTDGQSEPAGALLSRALAATGHKLSWLLLYDLGMKQYALNIQVVQ